MRFENFRVGDEFEYSYTVKEEFYNFYLRQIGDASPIHANKEFAIKNGFSDVLMHGALLNGFLSHFCGNIFPGAEGMSLSVDLRYSKPVYLGDSILIKAKVEQKTDSVRVVSTKLTFMNQTRNYICAAGKMQSRLFD